jgi:phage shock protein A
MEIAIGLIGVSLTILGLISAYIWKSNGQLQRDMMEALERIEQGQERGFKALAEGQERIAQMLLNQTKILERIERRIPLDKGV